MESREDNMNELVEITQASYRGGLVEVLIPAHHEEITFLSYLEREKKRLEANGRTVEIREMPRNMISLWANDLCERI